jgi:hypothetical protein
MTQSSQTPITDWRRDLAQLAAIGQKYRLELLPP